MQADDATLQTYLDANRATFRVEPKIAFDQVFLNPDKPGEAAPVRARKSLEVLKASEPGDGPADVGDPTLLPLSLVARNFGDTLAAKLTDVPENEWAGPIESPYGLHLVRVIARVDGYDPALRSFCSSHCKAFTGSRPVDPRLSPCRGGGGRGTSQRSKN